MSEIADEAPQAQEDDQFWAKVKATMTTPAARAELQREAESLGGVHEVQDGREDWRHLG